MSNRFLTPDNASVNISNGSTAIFGASIGAQNLNSGMPVKTDFLSNLVSSKLDISDVNNLQATLDSVLTNPYTGTLEATDLKTSTVPSLNDVVANMITNPLAGSFEAGSFVKTGATNQQYLMGDGSVLQQSAVSGNSNFYWVIN